MNNLRNKVQLIGRLGKDVEVKTLESGKMLAKVSLATSDIYKDANGKRVENTQWHNLTFWGGNAKNAGLLLKKGSEIAVEGRLNYSNYQDKDGNTRYFTDIIVNEFIKLDPKNKN
jgi:single-strand DNA-binding protein